MELLKLVITGDGGVKNHAAHECECTGSVIRILFECLESKTWRASENDAWSASVESFEFKTKKDLQMALNLFRSCNTDIDEDSKLHYNSYVFTRAKDGKIYDAAGMLVAKPKPTAVVPTTASAGTSDEEEEPEEEESDDAAAER